jgi:hypothetical protein
VPPGLPNVCSVTCLVYKLTSYFLWRHVGNYTNRIVLSVVTRTNTTVPLRWRTRFSLALEAPKERLSKKAFLKRDLHGN